MATTARRFRILGGGRVSGKAGAFNIGLLNMQTDDYQDRLASNNFTVVRVSRDLPNRSSIGGIFVNREGTGDLAPADDHNRTYAVDGKWGIGQTHRAFELRRQTETPGVTRRRLRVQRPVADQRAAVRSRARLSGSRRPLQPGGRVPQPARLSQAGCAPRHALAAAGLPQLQEVRPHASYRSFWGHDGFQETGYMHIDNHWQFRNAYEVHTGMNLTLEGVRAPFEIYPGIFVPPGTYEHKEAQLVFMTNQGAPHAA